MRDPNKLSCSEAGKLGAFAAKEIIAAQKQKRVESYYLDPIKCKYCGAPISYEKRFENKFCNHSCSASFNSPNLIHNADNPYNKFCLICKNSVKNGAKFCSRNCQKVNNWDVAKANLLQNGFDNKSKHQNAKRYLLELHSGKCQLCHLSEWMCKPMPLVLDHINGNSEDGALTNLRVICNNCDALTDTYKNKNKGNGRARRRQRYKEGKSY